MLGVAWASLGELGKLAQLGLRVVVPQGCPGSCCHSLLHRAEGHGMGKGHRTAEGQGTAREHSLAEGH